MTLDDSNQGREQGEDKKTYLDSRVQGHLELAKLDRLQHARQIEGKLIEDPEAKRFKREHAYWRHVSENRGFSLGEEGSEFKCISVLPLQPTMFLKAYLRR